jgi:TRAP-type C4-dicarboxylate transport system permease small subunit
MKKTERILTFLSNILAWLSVICISLMMVHVFLDVFLKYAIKQPIMGTAEVVANYYMLAAVFLPLPLVEFRNAGVSVTLFYDLISNRSFRRMIMLFALVGQIVFFVMLGYESGLDAIESFRKLEIVEGQIAIYIWPATFFLPLGLGVAAIVSVFRVFQVLLLSEWEQILD